MGAKVGPVITSLRGFPRSVGASLTCLLLGTVALTGCSESATEDGPGDGDEATEMEASALTSRTVRLGAGNTTFTLRQTRDQDLVLTIDCAPPANPDVVGPVFRLGAPTLGTTAADPPRAGYYRRSGLVPTGSHALTFTNLGMPTTCTVRTSEIPAAATCKTSTTFRSPNANHNHVAVGTDASSDWEPFPASGNHWGAWAPWNSIYDKPMKRGFMLHNLEHGGVVFSYKCNGPSESAACLDAKNQLIGIAQAIGGPRVILTPDPTQPEMFAIRGWRWAYSSSCLDPASALQFAQSRYRQGREDTDADPPIPFDPSTTDVPCEDLMSAPDSCAPR